MLNSKIKIYLLLKMIKKKMDVRITENQYLRIIDESIKSSIQLFEGEKRVDDDFITRFRNGITNKINDKLNTNPSLRKSADELGINPNFSADEKMNAVNQIFDKNGMISPKINDEVKKLSQYLKTVLMSEVL
jgi:hypothetical protein